MRPHSRCPEPWRTRLAVGIEAHRDDLTDVEAVGRRRFRRGHELVSPGGVSRPARTDGQAVHAGVLAPYAPQAAAPLYREQAALADGGARRAEGLGVDPHRASHGGDVRDLGDLSDDGRVVALPVADPGAGDGGGHLDLGRVGGLHQGGEGGLGPPGGRHRAHGQAPEQTEEQHDGEVRAPFLAESGPEAVPRGSQDRAHRAVLPGSVFSTYGPPTSTTNSDRSVHATAFLAPVPPTRWQAPMTKLVLALPTGRLRGTTTRPRGRRVRPSPEPTSRSAWMGAGVPANWRPP